MLLDSDPPTDFLTHLQRTLGTAEDVTIAVLGEWLERYEPLSRRAATGPGSPVPGSATYTQEFCGHSRIGA